MESVNRISEYVYRYYKYITQKENRGYAAGGMFAGGFYGAHLISSVNDFWGIFTTAFILKGLMGLTYLAMGGAAGKLGAILIEMIRDKIKTKYFDNGKKGDNEKRA